MKYVKSRSMKVMEALYFLPYGNRRAFKNAEKTVRFVRTVVEQRDLSYQAQVLIRAIMNILMCSGISRAYAEQAIEKIYETQNEARPKKPCIVKATL